MRINVIPVSAVIGSFVLLSFALGQMNASGTHKSDSSGMTHMVMGGADGFMGMAPGAGMMAEMNSVMMNLERLSGPSFNRAFLSMMIPHHQMAVDMSKAVLPRAKDATVRNWANQIIRDQEREIREMTAWLKAFGGTDARMTGMMQGMMSGMANRVTSAANPERAFVQDMIPHHASAIRMATLALQNANDDRVLTLARDIVRAQAQEMFDFQQWLKRP